MSNSFAKRNLIPVPNPVALRRARGWWGRWCLLTVQLLPHLALGGLQLDLPPEVARHLSVVGERRVDGELSFRGL